MLKPILMEVLDWGGHTVNKFFILSFDLVDACVKVVLWSLSVLSLGLLSTGGEPRHSGLRFLQNFIIVHLIVVRFPKIGWFSLRGMGSCSRSMGRVDLYSFCGSILHKLEHHGLRRFHIYDWNRWRYIWLFSGQQIFSPRRILNSIFNFLSKVSFVFAALIHTQVGIKLFVFENFILLVKT